MSQNYRVPHGNSLDGVRFAKSTAEGNRIEALDGGRQTLEKKRCFSVFRVQRLPRSLIKSIPQLLIGPRVSKATGTNWWLSKRLSYLVIFLVAANSAAAPAVVFVAYRYDEAAVSIMVASHTRLRPPRQGINVSPSGLFPSVRESPGCSLMLGIPACVRPLLMMSFMVACLAIRFGPRPHDRPCEPFAVTTVPHRQVLGSHITLPSRRPTTTRIVSSSIRSPHDEIGSANSQSPA